MLLHKVKLTNLLSYGDDSKEILLSPLNVIIGPNGSGKSNLLESIELLRNAPEQILKPIREGGGVRDWLSKGNKGAVKASIDVVVDYPKGQNKQNLRYKLSFTEVGQRFEIVDECVEEETKRSPSL